MLLLNWSENGIRHIVKRESGTTIRFNGAINIFSRSCCYVIDIIEDAGEEGLLQALCGGFMMKRLEKVFLALCAIAAVQAISVADAHASEVKTLMKHLDTDNDGLISLKEAVRHTELLRNFGLIDDDHDGKLSETELAKSKLTPKAITLAANQA
ncbi:hypothetical protein D210916BOD24_20650 [Alteromonas sp. D210916BOD_24]|uniref:EF-hand domain-containing protein n=1 Tax=Alteromonas sp. D210916BOD_24 TaxID=3157618 RepID=UPI00399CB45A